MKLIKKGIKKRLFIKKINKKRGKTMWEKIKKHAIHKQR